MLSFLLGMLQPLCKHPKCSHELLLQLLYSKPGEGHISLLLNYEQAMCNGKQPLSCCILKDREPNLDFTETSRDFAFWQAQI